MAGVYVSANIAQEVLDPSRPRLAGGFDHLARVVTQVEERVRPHQIEGLSKPEPAG